MGYRGADVDSIIKDLVEVAINHVRERDLKKVLLLQHYMRAPRELPFDIEHLPVPSLLH